jgi:hypothetical protein
MKIVDAQADIEKFWFALGEKRVMAALKGQVVDIVVELENSNVVDTLSGSDAFEAGRPAFLRGLNKKLDEIMAVPAWAPKVKEVLALYVGAMPAGKVTVRKPEKKMLRKTVETDADGRILAMTEVEL